MIDKRGRRPSEDAETWPDDIAPSTLLLSLEEKLFQVLRKRQKLRSQSASTNILEEWFGRKKSWDYTARSNWKLNRRRISPETFASNYMQALALDGSQLFPDIDTDGDKLYRLDRIWWDSAETKLFREQIYKQFGIQLNRIADFQSSLKMPDELLASVVSTGTATARDTLSLAGNEFWRPIGRSDFEPPVHDNNEIRSYLAGKQSVGLWVARHGGVWRQDIIERVRALLADVSVLTLHGPAGHGKSTVARQIVASVVEEGHPAIFLRSLVAFQDPDLTAFCQQSASETGEVYLLLDDLVISEELPPWILLDEKCRFKVINTVQSRKLHLMKRQLDGAKIGRFKVSPPLDLSPYVENVIQHGAGFTKDPNEVEALFRSGFANGKGGLWGATWEATRGESIDQRIGAIVADAFEKPSEWLAISAIAFFCGVHEFSRNFRQQPTRDFIASIIRNHPSIDPKIAEDAINSLYRLREILADELLNFGEDFAIIDMRADPVLEFRAPSVAHSFFRWIFGSFSPARGHRLSRWPFYHALAASLIETDSGSPDLTLGIESLNASWDTGFRARNSEIDHGRSGSNLAELANAFLTPDLTSNDAMWRNVHIADSYLLATKEPQCTEEEIQSLCDRATERLLVATTDAAPYRILSVAAHLTAKYDLQARNNNQLIDAFSLYERAINKAAKPNERSIARVAYFADVCRFHQGVSLSQKWRNIFEGDLDFLAKNMALPSIIRGYLDIVRNPKNRDTVNQFLTDERYTKSLDNAVSTFGFFCASTVARAELMKTLSQRIGRLMPGQHAHYSEVASILEVLRFMSSKQVPFAKVFGAALDDLRKHAFQTIIEEGNHSEIIPWLTNTARNLPPFE